MKLRFVTCVFVSFTLASLAFSEAETGQAPLNKYGAVDATANIPYDIQVPATPASFVPPNIVPANTAWETRVPKAPTLAAKSYMLIEANSAQILAAEHANDRLPPASITKLMLVYVLDHSLANKDISLDQILSVPTVAWATGGSRMFLKPNDKVSVEDLISGVVVDSGNDAAVTLATAIAGTQEAFVALMNHQAEVLGMSNTHFADVMGLPAPAHYTSARDLAVLGEHLLQDYPQYVSWFGVKSFTYNGISQENFNKLLFIYPYAIGLKTGSTTAAGYSLVSAAQKPGSPMQLVGVVLSSGSRDNSANESKALLEYGFRNFETEKLYSQGQPVTNTPVLNAQELSVPLGVSKDFYVTFPKGAEKSLVAQVAINPGLSAPIQKGQALGTLIITLDGKTLTTSPLVALKEDALQSIWQSIGRKLRSWV